jgi:hypothetical protein
MSRILNSLFLLILVSCNPVKQVLKDREKLDQVAEVVIRSGYCANDTIIQTKSDTTIVTDTLFQAFTDTIIRTNSDTIRVPKTQIIRQKITIRDTVRSVVVDRARINVLEKDILILGDKLAESKALAKKRFWYLFWLIAFIIAYLLRKPVLKFIAWHS